MGFISYIDKQTTLAMVKMSVLNDALKNIVNAEKAGKRQVMLRPISKVLVKFLRCMQKHGYINEFEIIDDNRAGKIVVELNGRLNKCGVISPRFDMTLQKFENFTSSFLPVSSVSSYSPPTRVSWTTRRPVESILEERSLATSIEAALCVTQA